MKEFKVDVLCILRFDNVLKMVSAHDFLNRIVDNYHSYDSLTESNSKQTTYTIDGPNKKCPKKIKT